MKATIIAVEALDLYASFFRMPSGQGIGMAIHFPLLFFAGVWIPRGVMSDRLRTFSNLVPVGAAAQTLEDSWLGTTPSLFHLVVMALWAAALGALAVRVFRWE